MTQGYAESWPDVIGAGSGLVKRLQQENAELRTQSVLLRGEIVTLKEKLATLRRAVKRADKPEWSR